MVLVRCGQKQKRLLDDKMPKNLMMYALISIEAKKLVY
jgi:hypothetical protein